MSFENRDFVVELQNILFQSLYTWIAALNSLPVPIFIYLFIFFLSFGLLFLFSFILGGLSCILLVY